MEYIGEYEKQICIVEETNQYFEPVKLIRYWPVGISSLDFKRNFGEDFMGKKCWYRTNGIYEVDCSGTLKIQLIDGAQTRPIHTDSIPIVPPKVKKGIETRYYEGNWQKHLKTKGWVLA